jgi:hypothetical protein
MVWLSIVLNLSCALTLVGPEIESFGSHGFGMLADQCIDILEDEMALFARGI